MPYNTEILSDFFLFISVQCLVKLKKIFSMCFVKKNDLYNLIWKYHIPNLNLSQ